MLTSFSMMAPTVGAAFLASLVEFVEALTIVLAVGTVRGWRPAMIGTLAGVALLTLLVVVLGPLLTLVPLPPLQIVVGILLLLFGMRWLRKAILRSAGLIPLHDEALAYQRETGTLGKVEAAETTWDTIAVATSFKAVVLEGLEVVFIVIALGATGGRLPSAALGAALALLLVVMAGLVLHRPLARVPENLLKFTVGVLLSAFGVFWVGEGAGLIWLGEDMAILWLALGFSAVALVMVRVLAAMRERALDARSMRGSTT